MAIKIYQSQIRPTESTGEVYTTPGLKISSEEASQFGAGIKSALKAGVEVYGSIEKQKSDNELIKTQEKMNKGGDDFEGLLEAQRKASLMTDSKEGTAYYQSAFEKAKTMVMQDGFKYNFTKSLFNDYEIKNNALISSHIVQAANNNLYKESVDLDGIKTERLTVEKNNGLTPQIRDAAALELENHLNSQKFKELHGAATSKKIFEIKGKDELHQAKNAILRNPSIDENELINRFKNLDTSQIDKIRAYKKTQLGTLEAGVGMFITDVTKQVDSFAPVDSANLAQQAQIAAANKNVKHLADLQDISIKDSLNKLVSLNPASASEILADQLESNKKMLQSSETNPIEKRKAQTAISHIENIQKAFSTNAIDAAAKFKIFDTPVGDNNGGIKSLNLENFLNNPFQDSTPLINAGKERLKQSIYMQQNVPGAARSIFTQPEVDIINKHLTNATNPKSLAGIIKKVGEASGGEPITAWKQIAGANKDKVNMQAHAYVGGLGEIIPGETYTTLTKEYALGEVSRKSSKAKYENGKATANGQKIEAERIKLRQAFIKDPQTVEAILYAAENIFLGKNYTKEGVLTLDDEYAKTITQLVGGNDKTGGIDNSLNQPLPVVAPTWLPKNKMQDVAEMFKQNPALFFKASNNAQGIGTIDQSSFNPFNLKIQEMSDNGEIVYENKDVRNPSFVNIGNGVYQLAYGDVSLPGSEKFIISDSAELNNPNKILTVDLNLIKDEVLQNIKDNEFSFSKTIKGIGSFIGDGFTATATIDRTPSQVGATYENKSKKDLPKIKVENKKQEMGITGDLMDMAGQNLAYKMSEFFFGDPVAFETMGIKFDKLSPEKQEYIKAFLNYEKDWLYKKPGKISFPTNERQRQHNKKY